MDIHPMRVDLGVAVGLPGSERFTAGIDLAKIYNSNSLSTKDVSWRRYGRLGLPLLPIGSHIILSL